MQQSDALHDDAVQAIVGAIQTRMPLCKRPFLVGIDGGSGAGKSTIAFLVAQSLNAIVVPSDDFYAAHISNSNWEQWTPPERYMVVIDWRRLRTEALEPLLNGMSARWHAFDFMQQRIDGTYPLSADWVTRDPTDLIVLEGAYSTRPELADIIHLKVLVDVAVKTRHERLIQREDDDFLARWHARWDAVEEHYFSQIRPSWSFDLVVTN